MRSLYFIGYACILTVSCLTVAFAQYNRLNEEGTPINFSLLKVIGGIALFMWMAAGMTALIYAYTA